MSQVLHEEYKYDFKKKNINLYLLGPPEVIDTKVEYDLILINNSFGRKMIRPMNCHGDEN